MTIQLANARPIAVTLASPIVVSGDGVSSRRNYQPIRRDVGSGKAHCALSYCIAMN